jgi:pilus assembly protein CpaB
MNRPFVLLSLAALAGLMALGLAARWLKAQTADHVPLVVAHADIALGTPLEASMLTTIAWPPNAWPEGGQTDPGALVGRVLRTPLTRHEPVLEAKLAALGSRGGLSAVITPGKRALTVKVNEVMGVAGFALPGSLVDVMVHTQTDADRHVRDSGLSKIVLERILVLAVAQDAGRDATAPRVASAVTLEVSPDEAERLDLARSVGTLSLVLRNQADAAPALTQGARKPDLLLAANAPHTPIAGPATTPTNAASHRSSTPRDKASTTSRTHHAEQIEESASPRTEVIRGTQRSSTAW